MKARYQLFTNPGLKKPLLQDEEQDPEFFLQHRDQDQYKVMQRDAIIKEKEHTSLLLQYLSELRELHHKKQDRQLIRECFSKLEKHKKFHRLEWMDVTSGENAFFNLVREHCALMDPVTDFTSYSVPGIKDSVMNGHTKKFNDFMYYYARCKQTLEKKIVSYDESIQFWDKQLDETMRLSI